MAANPVMEQAPVCSVCIANYNGIAVIDACICSVLAQDCAFPVEIIIHDDASTDESVALIRNRFPQVQLIVSERNVGFCESNNRMVAKARGQYVLLLNNDAELYPDALRTLHQEAGSRSGPCILGLPQYDAATGALIDIGSIFDPFLNAVPNRDPARRDVGMVIGACLWIPKALWVELGGFPNWFGSLAEDMYLCCLARLKGYPVEVVPRSGFRHWVGKALGGGKVVENRLATTVARRSLSERNKSFVMVICYPAPGFQLLFPLHLAALLLEGLALALVKKDGRVLAAIYLATFRALWQERSALRRLRQTVQSGKRIRAAKFFSVFTPSIYKMAMLMKHGVPKLR